MISGHLGIAAATASGREKVLDVRWAMVLGAAAFLPDVVDIGLAAFGVCNPSGLYSHSIPVVLVLAAIAAGVTLLGTGIRRDALFVALLVLAHPAADFITGNKLLWPGGEQYGLRLYQRPVADFALEMTLFAVGCLLLYMRGMAPPRSLSALLVAGTLVGQLGFDLIASRVFSLKPSACESTSDTV